MSRLEAQLAALPAHIRDPATQAPPPDIDPQRAAVYRRLFLNSLLGLLSTNFPVLRRLLGPQVWPALVEDFYRDWRCRTPLFTEVAREFLRYLDQRAGEGRSDPPWLRELALYEWAELALDLSEAEPADVPHDPAGDLLAGRPLLSPLCWLMAFAWPVHRLAPVYLPEAPPAQPSCLLLHRDRAGRVRFRELSAPAFRLLQRISEQESASGHALLLALAAEAGADPRDFLAEGAALLERMRAEGILLGTAPTD